MHTMDLTLLSDALPYSTRYNSKIGRESMDVVMLDACMKNRNVTSVAMARRNTEVSESRLPRTPCGEQMMRLMRAADPALLSGLFLADVQRTAGRMKAMGRLDGPVEISIDGHKIPRDDGRQRPELVNSQSKKRTGQFELYVTAQCITGGGRITLGVVPQRKLETVSDIVPKLIHICRRAGVEIGIVMMDREFFTAQVIKYMSENAVPFLIPCRDTDTTVDTLREYAGDSRGRVSELTIRGGRGKIRVRLHRHNHKEEAQEKEGRGSGGSRGKIHRVCDQQAGHRPGRVPAEMEHRGRLPDTGGRAGKDAVHRARGPHVLLYVLVPVLQRMGDGRRPAGRRIPHAGHARQGPEMDGVCNGAWQAPV